MSRIDLKQRNDSVDSVEKSGTGKAKNIALWVLQVLAAGMFLMAGSGKLAGSEQMTATFNTIGLGQWFRYFTGGIEVLSAVLLLIPSLSGIGALLMVGTMIGAVATHLFILGGTAIPAAVLLVVTAIIAFGRREQITNLINRVLNKV